MIDEAAERTGDFRTVPGGETKKRPHRWSKGEREGHPRAPEEDAKEHRIRQRSLDELHKHEIAEALGPKPPAEPTNGKDLNWDSQTLREVEAASRGDDGRDGKPKAPQPLSGEALRKAKREARHTTRLKWFGSERRRGNL